MKKTLTTAKAILILAMVGLLCSTPYAQNQKQLWGVAFGGQNDAGVIFKTDASGNNEMRSKQCGLFVSIRSPYMDLYNKV